MSQILLFQTLLSKPFLFPSPILTPPPSQSITSHSKCVTAVEMGKEEEE
jgi:hypothetical protein